MLIYLVYFTFCKTCERSSGYKDTYLASLIKHVIYYVIVKYNLNMTELNVTVPACVDPQSE